MQPAEYLKLSTKQTDAILSASHQPLCKLYWERGKKSTLPTPSRLPQLNDLIRFTFSGTAKSCSPCSFSSLAGQPLSRSWGDYELPRSPSCLQKPAPSYQGEQLGVGGAHRLRSPSSSMSQEWVSFRSKKEFNLWLWNTFMKCGVCVWLSCFQREREKCLAL